MNDAPAPIRLGITIGDPGGIGPEVALRALAVWGQRPPAERAAVAPFLIGPGSLWSAHAARLRERQPDLAPQLDAALADAFILQSDDPEAGKPHRWAQTNPRHGAIAIGAIEKATRLCLAGELDAILTAPISKEGIHLAGCPHPGHTELLQSLTGSPDVGMLLVGGGLRVALATIHVSLRQVFELLTPELVLRKAALLHDFVRLWLGRSPRIGLCGLNPHAGEGGLFGDEEETILWPAVEAALRQGIELDGPHPPDTIFHDHLKGRFDAVLALYHDQGLIAVKTLAFDTGVNVTMGLPIVRTSPDHGTAFGIAGRAEASGASTCAAWDLAVELAVARRRGGTT